MLSITGLHKESVVIWVFCLFVKIFLALKVKIKWNSLKKSRFTISSPCVYYIMFIILNCSSYLLKIVKHEIYRDTYLLLLGLRYSTARPGPILIIFHKIFSLRLIST